MSGRSLNRRMDALTGGREPEEVIEALRMLDKTGTAPPGRAGERAQELWDEATQKGLMKEIRFLACYMRATGKSLAELVAESGDEEPVTRGETDDERETEVG